MLSARAFDPGPAAVQTKTQNADSVARRSLNSFKSSEMDLEWG